MTGIKCKDEINQLVQSGKWGNLNVHSLMTRQTVETITAIFHSSFLKQTFSGRLMRFLSGFWDQIFRTICIFVCYLHLALVTGSVHYVPGVYIFWLSWKSSHMHVTHADTGSWLEGDPLEGMCFMKKRDLYWGIKLGSHEHHWGNRLQRRMCRLWTERIWGR